MSTSNILLGLLNVVTVVVFFDLPTLSVYNTLIIGTEYDYIIVGAGSAGCALANRLSADRTKTVLLLEAGGLEDEAVQVPFFAPLLQRTSLDWQYMSVPQQNASYLFNRFPRGKTLGGSSSINYIIYSRGDKRDYDAWSSTYGATGWSYDEVLPYFVDLETSSLGYDSDLRGSSGEVPVSFPTSHTVASDAFLDAGEELGYGQGDYNSGDQYCVLSRPFGVECVAFLSTPQADPEYPDIQFLLSTLNPTTSEAEYIAREIGISQVDDIDVAVAGARLAVQTFQTEAMKKVNVTLFDIPVPGCESAGALWSDSYLHCLVRQTAHSGWHPCCTAPMGTHPAAVLDSRLRVRSVSRLRVADASSMPMELSGNLNIPMMMLGTKAAAMIMEDNA
ncbi:hypothetical protein MTO96_041901 [Rhipicephalus appendiculatus]